MWAMQGKKGKKRGFTWRLGSPADVSPGCVTRGPSIAWWLEVLRGAGRCCGPPGHASRDHRAVAGCLARPHPVPQRRACSLALSLVLSWVSGWCLVSLGHIWLWVCRSGGQPQMSEGSPSCRWLSPPVFPHQRTPLPPRPARPTAPSCRLLPGLCPPRRCVGLHS